MIKIEYLEQLSAQLKERKPQDNTDDFWLFSLVRDDPKHPTWQERLSTVGTYDQCANALLVLLARLVNEGARGEAHIEVFRGDTARHMLARGIQEEARYQKEVGAQGNN